MTNDSDPPDLAVELDEPLDPKQHLIARYENVLSLQFDKLRTLDEKAARAARLVTIFLGLFITGLSLAVGTDDVALTFTDPVILMAAGTVISLVITIWFAVLTYLSSKLAIGPGDEWADGIANSDSPDLRQYKTELLRTYIENSVTNRRVLKANERRFRNCLCGFMVSLIGLLATSVLAATSFSTIANIGIALGTLIFAGGVVRYITSEGYLVLDERGNHE